MIHSANFAWLRYLLHVSSAVGLLFRSQYLKFFKAILYSWLCISELATPSRQKFLMHAKYYQSFLYLGYSGLYSGNYYVCSTSEILLKTLYQRQHHAMQDFIFMDFSATDFYGSKQFWFTAWLKYYWLSLQISSLYIIQNGLVFWSSDSVLL